MTTAFDSALPILSADGGLFRYFQEIRKFPVLDADEEYMLAQRFKEHGDVSAAHRLVTSHLRLVAKIAYGYRGYGLPLVELVSEGNIGLMQAVKKFDPERGFRLSTYAMWWIKAAIQEYVLRSWSMVKVGSSAAQKRLFFNLRKIKNRILKADETHLSPEAARKVARDLDVSEQEVIDMDMRMSAVDRSLNQMVGPDSDDEWIDLLADQSASQEEGLLQSQEHGNRMLLLQNAMSGLTPRELDIFKSRRLQEEPSTLEELSQRHGISRERVRQIENRAFEKIQEAVTSSA